MRRVFVCMLILAVSLVGISHVCAKRIINESADLVSGVVEGKRSALFSSLGILAAALGVGAGYYKSQEVSDEEKIKILGDYISMAAKEDCDLTEEEQKIKTDLRAKIEHLIERDEFIHDDICMYLEQLESQKNSFSLKKWFFVAATVVDLMALMLTSRGVPVDPDIIDYPDCPDYPDIYAITDCMQY